MPKKKRFTADEVIKILSTHGFEKVSQKFRPFYVGRRLEQMLEQDY